MKILKITGYVILSLAIIGVMLKILFGYVNQHYLVPYLIKQVDTKTFGRYTLHIKDNLVDPGFFTTDLIMSHVELKRDSTINKNSGIDLLDRFDVYFSFDSLKISVLNPISYLIYKKIEISRIDLINPRYLVAKNMNYKPEEQNSKNIDTGQMQDIRIDSAGVTSDTTSWKEFRQAQKSIRPVMKVDLFRIDNLNFEFYEGLEKTAVNGIYGMDIHFTKLKIDKNNKLTVADAGISIDSAWTMVSRKVAQLDLKNASFYPDSFSIGSLHFRHVVDRYQINKLRGFRASWLDAEVDDIRFMGLHPRMLVNDSILDIDKVSMGNVSLFLFKDKSEPVINPSHKALPSEQVRGIPAKLKIDTIEIQGGVITVAMEAPDARRPGKIVLNRFSAEVTNLTNIPEFLAVNPSMVLNTNFALMDSAQIGLTASFRIDSPEDEFTVSCHAEPFYAAVLNDFLGSQFFIDFKSGYIKGLDFDFEGNNKANVGTMDLEYEDLQIEKYHEFKRYIDSKPHTGFIAFMGNTLVPNKRSKEDPNYKTGVIYYEKEYNRDFIHGTIMSMLSGLSSSLGFSSRDLGKKQEQAGELDASATRESAKEAEEKAEKAKKKEEKISN